MYLDTYTRQSMESSICKCLEIECGKLKNIFENMYKGDRECEKHLKDIVNTCNSINEIDEILVFHFSRRLNSEEDVSSYNLYDLLLKETSISNFLKKYDISFKMGEEHLELFYKGTLKEFGNSHDPKVAYMKTRMGYFKSSPDYCVNGLAFRDLIYRNYYCKSLFVGAEFLNQLFEVLEREDVRREYIKNSKYYCLEYKIPIEKVIFCEREQLSLLGKKKKIVFEVLKRLYNYYVQGNNYIDDEDNPLLRLEDDDNIESRYFVSKKEILLDEIKS